jgi:hypothetical protein
VVSLKDAAFLAFTSAGFDVRRDRANLATFGVMVMEAVSEPI